MAVDNGGYDMFQIRWLHVFEERIPMQSGGLATATTGVTWGTTPGIFVTEDFGGQRPARVLCINHDPETRQHLQQNASQFHAISIAQAQV